MLQNTNTVPQQLLWKEAMVIIIIIIVVKVIEKPKRNRNRRLDPNAESRSAEEEVAVLATCRTTCSYESSAEGKQLQEGGRGKWLSLIASR